MKILSVENMHCKKCVDRITKAFAVENFEFEVNLDSKTVAVPRDKVETAKEILEDLGFDIEK